MSGPDIEIDRHESHLVVRWTVAGRTGGARIDHVPGTVPAWIGPADELVEGASRRDADRIVAAVDRWADDAGLEIGLWHDDGGVEVVGRRA